jgi:septal ring factor EnvC (AmiA/AmiB activator)
MFKTFNSLFDRILYWIVCVCILILTSLSVQNRIEMDRRTEQRDQEVKKIDQKIETVQQDVSHVETKISTTQK